MSLIVHLLVENTIYQDGAVFMLFIENIMVPKFKTQESSLDDIIVFFKESRQTVQSLYSGVNPPSLLF